MLKGQNYSEGLNPVVGRKMLRAMLYYAAFSLVLLVTGLWINAAALVCLSLLVFLNISLITVKIVSRDARQITYLKVWEYSIINFNILTVTFSSGILIFKMLNGMLNIHNSFSFLLIVSPVLLYLINWIISSLLNSNMQYIISTNSNVFLKAISYFSLILLIIGCLIIALNWDGFDWILASIIALFYVFQVAIILRQKINLEE